MAKLNFSASESPKEKEKKGFWSQSFPLCRYLLCFLHSSTVRMGAPFTPRQQQGAKLMCHHLHQHRLQEPIPPLQASSVDHHNHGAFVFKSNCFFFFFLKEKKNFEAYNGSIFCHGHPLPSEYLWTGNVSLRSSFTWGRGLSFPYSRKEGGQKKCPNLVQTFVMPLPKCELFFLAHN